MCTLRLDDQGRIKIPDDLRAKLNLKPGDELVVGEATSDSITLKKMDLRTILEGVVEEAQNVDLDKVESDIEEEGNRIAREKIYPMIVIARHQ